MDRLHLMTVFVAVAEEESFAAAARRLSMSPPAITRAIAALEARLGVKLLHRTTRFVRPTEAGLRYQEDARRVIASADEADASATGINAEPRGQLVVTASVLFGRMFVMPGIVDYLQRYPKTEVSALFLDRVVNLLEEGVDVGIRIGELPDSSLNALRVGSVRRVVCATPGYLQQYGEPQSPSDLQAHRVITTTSVASAVEWKFRKNDTPFTVKVQPRLSVLNYDAAIDAAVLGVGLTQLMYYQVAHHVAAGTLRVVLCDYETAPLPVHIIHSEGRYTATKIRAFVDLMAQRLRADSSLNG